jgi:alpha-L-rhamnosidase
MVDNIRAYPISNHEAFMRIGVALLCSSLLIGFNASAQVKERYKTIHGGSYSGKTIPQSPDPLINYRWKDPKASDSLQIYISQPKKSIGYPAHSFVIDKKSIAVMGKGDLLIDFGAMHAGWIEFESDDLDDTVEVSISEYNEPAIVNEGAINPVKTKAPQKYGNTYRLELNEELYEGVRFAWIHVRRFSKPCRIQNIRLVAQVKPVNYNGSFSCSDTMLTRIWYTGAYTVRLNLLQDHFGAILMERSDRHSWTGDAYPAQAAALAAFGNYDMIRQNIAFTSNQDNGIPAYSLYWVLSLVDYYNYTGDTAFLKKYIANADARLQKAYEHYEKLPWLNFMGWDERLGAGFENPQNEESKFTYQMLCINVWQEFAKAIATINEQELSAKHGQFAAQKILQMKQDPERFNRFGIHAITEAVNAGLYENASVRRVADSLFSDRQNRLSYSPFNQYFIIQAMALAGEKNKALITVKDNWGGQIHYGGTTFFEVYRPSWNSILQKNDAPPNNQCGYTSLAHPWGAGVTKWLTENVLGVQPLAPGFKTFTIVPYLSSYITWAKGSVPTPFGTVTVAFDVLAGTGNVTIPQGTVASKIGIPKAGREILSLTMNKHLFTNKDGWHSQGSYEIEEDNGYVYLKNVKAGRYEIRMKYGRKSLAADSVDKSLQYHITNITKDRQTSGRWKSKFGSKGYVLFGKDSPQKLPAYIERIRVQKADTVSWQSSINDPRLLEGLQDKEATALITRDPQPTLQTFTIDVHSNDTTGYKISLYFLDWDRKERRSAIEIFSLKTLELLAPVQLIGNYENGTYLSFDVNQPIRIRVNHVRGENAAVSGVFFDNVRKR